MRINDQVCLLLHVIKCKIRYKTLEVLTDIESWAFQ